MRYTLTPLAVLAVITVSLAGLAADTGEEALDLSLRLQKGDTYQFTTEIQKTVGRWVDEVESSQTNTLALTQTVEVVSVKDDGTITLKVTYDRVTLKCEADSGSFEFDSDSPPDELEFPANIFAALVGQSLDVKVSPTGKITGITNSHMVHMALMRALQGDSEEEDGDGSHIVRITVQGTNAAILANNDEAMRLVHDEKAFKEHLAFLAVLYADAPVKTGETWNKTEKRTGQYAGTYETAYKLVSRGNGAAEIELAGTIKGDPKAKPPKMGVTFGLVSGMTDLEGNQKGTFKVDENSGLVREGTLSRSIKGNTSTFNPAVDPENLIPTPTTIDTTITIKGAKLAQPEEKAAPKEDSPALPDSTDAE